MGTYRVTARRAGDGWSLRTPFGELQAPSLRVGEKAARDHIAAATDSAVGDVAVALAPKLPLDLGAEVVEVRDAQVELAALQASVATRARAVAARLRTAGLANTDIAQVMGVSEQRVSQLFKSGSGG